MTPPAGPVQATDAFVLNAQSVTLPYTITQPGTYRLTSNLTGATDGIIVDADNVTIDLNGFTLGGGTGYGVRGAYGQIRTGVRIINGHVTGWGFAGITGGAIDTITFDTAILNEMIVEGVTLSNCGTGVQGGQSALIVNTIAFDCAVGIASGDGGLVRSATVRGCTTANVILNQGGSLLDSSLTGGTTGVSASDNASVRNTTIRNTGANGITCLGPGVTIESSTVDNAGAIGIEATWPNNSIRECSVLNSAGVGIKVYLQGIIQDSTINNSGFHGIMSDEQPFQIDGRNVVMDNIIMFSTGDAVNFANSQLNYIYRNMVSNAITSNLATDAPFTIDPTTADPLDNVLR
ncbi:MAG: right-handed parallel beta-helix repeat-containing protein [Phycisphaerales bacterium JB043]